MNKQSVNNEIANKIYLDLLRIYGPMVSSKDLPTVLAYPSVQAFRQAIARKTVPVQLFAIPKRKGRFAMTEDIAQWLASIKKQ